MGPELPHNVGIIFNLLFVEENEVFARDNLKYQYLYRKIWLSLLITQLCK